MRLAKFCSKIIVVFYYLMLQICNNFLAGNKLRSNKRFKVFDETAVNGSVCRHEVPLRFLNLYHGERYFLLAHMKC